jgi:hypothetical protein
MARFVRWLRANIEAVLALAVAVTVGLLTVLEVRGVDPQTISSAILLVLGLLAVTLLRDRRIIARIFEDRSAVRVLSGLEVGHALAVSRQDTDQWLFKGGTGTYLRAVTLPKCVENARRKQRPLDVRIEILDPTNVKLCAAYAQFRHSLNPGPDGTGELWNTERTRKEAYATILASCWFQSRFTFLDVELGLSSVMSTFRWDMSSNCLIMTQESPGGLALAFDKDSPFFNAYSRELLTSFRHTRQVRLERLGDLPLPEEPTLDEVREIFQLLEIELPRDFIDRDVDEVLKKAVRAKNPY